MDPVDRAPSLAWDEIVTDGDFGDTWLPATPEPEPQPPRRPAAPPRGDDSGLPWAVVIVAVGLIGLQNERDLRGRSRAGRNRCSSLAHAPASPVAPPPDARASGSHVRGA